MERKFTDSEIVKALECCRDCKCKECPCYVKDVNGCREISPENILSLINRQKAEIQRLQRLLVEQHNSIDEIVRQPKNEVIKEFAERLKPKLGFGRYTSYEELDNLVKEMTENGE